MVLFLAAVMAKMQGATVAQNAAANSIVPQRLEVAGSQNSQPRKALYAVGEQGLTGFKSGICCRVKSKMARRLCSTRLLRHITTGQSSLPEHHLIRHK
jgi:hypothetical protein